MKETFEVDAFIPKTNRSPIMVLDGNKFRSLELIIKEALEGHLNFVTHRRSWNTNPWWGKTISEDAKRVVDSLSADNVRPHTKKLKITIEIEE